MFFPYSDSDEQVLRIYGSISQVLPFIEWMQKRMQSVRALAGYGAQYTCAPARSDEVCVW